MIINKKIILVKSILILSISIISNDILYANEKPMTAIWERQVNNCTENYIFSSFSNTFSIISSTGKNILGTYTQTFIINSDRVKLSLIVNRDNGVNDCFNSTYNSSGKIFILYAFLNPNTHMLQLSESKRGNYFGFFYRIRLLDKQMDAVAFQLIFNTLLADTKVKNEQLRRVPSSSNIGLSSVQSSANHATTMGIINNMATSDHYDSSTDEYEGSW